MATLKTLSSKSIARVFRRAYLKRRDATTGLFEDDWQEITDDVMNWGVLASSIDDALFNKFTFNNVRLILQNTTGRYNPHSFESSIWYGYANQQRSLVKIEAGFVDESTTSGVVTRTEYPTVTTAFVGIISGDMVVSDDNKVPLNIKSLQQVFRDFPAAALTGWTTVGFTASDFITKMVRDATDGSSSLIFRPFFQDTTTNWNIVSTTNIYSNLNTSGAEDVINSSVWDIIEKLAQAEVAVPYIDREGIFNFRLRSDVTTTVAWQFHGLGSDDTEYGHLIKKISEFGLKVTKYYSRVQIKWAAADTSASYESVNATFSVSGTNNPWNLGHRKLELQNFWIPSAAVASSIATIIFNETSSLKNEIKFTSSFVPGLEVLDRISISYDSAGLGNEESLWGVNYWAHPTANSTTDLILDSNIGDAINLEDTEFKIMSIRHNLDGFETEITAREI